MTTAWIPEQFAKQGMILDLKEKDGWDRGWEVKIATQSGLSSQYLRDNENNYRTHRRGIDI